MRGTTAAIVFTGIAGVLALVLMAMFSMDQVTGTPAGERTRVALLVKERFAFTNVQVDPASADLYFILERRHPGEAPAPDEARERAAQKLFLDGKRFHAELRDAESKKAFDKLREYPESEAFGELEMWDIADYIIKTYEGPDRDTIETLRLVRRTAYGKDEWKEQTMEPRKLPKKATRRPPTDPGRNPLEAPDPSRELRRK
jgi:hypothetical protein